MECGLSQNVAMEGWGAGEMLSWALGPLSSSVHWHALTAHVTLCHSCSTSAMSQREKAVAAVAARGGLCRLRHS